MESLTRVLCCTRRLQRLAGSERGEQVDGIADADITLDFAVVALTTSVHCY
jgi:hypothetical protein